MKQLSWPGAGQHEGHTVTAIERWPSRIEGATVSLGPRVEVSGGKLTCGRVRCTCGTEWNVSGWPLEVADQLFEGVDE